VNQDKVFKRFTKFSKSGNNLNRITLKGGD